MTAWRLLAWPARPVAWLLRELLRLGILLDLACHRLVARAVPPQHVLLGACQRRGMCCRHIVADPPRAIKRRPWAMRWLAAFHRAAHRFEVVGRGEEGALIFACGHLTAAGRCGIYRYRPRLCRAYPVLPFFGPPRLLPGCGYRTARREVAAMRARPALQILNAHVSVHHPDPGRGGVERPEDFHLVAEPPGRGEAGGGIPSTAAGPAELNGPGATVSRRAPSAADTSGAP